MKCGLTLAVILVIILLADLPDCHAERDVDGEILVAESKLYKYLVDNINPNLRPVNRTSHNVTVSFGVAILKILEVNEVQGSIRLQTWLRYTWSDIRMRWDPSDFDGITHIRIPIDKIWQPDIVLYNAASPLNKDDIYDALAIVYSSGFVLWIPSAILHSQCEFDMKHYPFDYQVCYLKFGSWTYDGWKIHLQFYDRLAELDVSDYISHSEWEVTQTRGTRNMKYYPCCEEPYPDLTFNLTMRRRPNYLRSVYYAPPVLVSLLLPFIFALPAQHTGRYLVAVGGLLVMIVQIQPLHDVFPKGQVSYLSYYYIATFSYNFVCLWLTILISWLAGKSRTNQLAPALLKWIFIDLLGRVLCQPASTYVDFVQSGEAKSSDGGDATSKDAPPGSGAAEWLSIARVLDRIFFILSWLIIFILACCFIPLPRTGP